MTDRDACRQALTGCFADLIIPLRRDLRNTSTTDSGCRPRGAGDGHQLPRAGELPGGAADAAGGRRSGGAGQLHGALAALPARGSLHGASKAALSWFANSLRLDWEPKGVAVTVVSPGFVDTPLTRKNDFAMPGRVSVDRAVAAIRHGLAKGKTTSPSPTGFSLALRLLASLPSGIQRLLLRRMVRS